MEPVRIVGIDCAVQPENAAVAVGDWTPNGLQIREAMHCKGRAVSDVVCAFLDGAGCAILALDAPLGWPTALGETLARHRAGATVEASGHRLFRRDTDEIVKSVTGKQPLDVGADRIARTAAAALTLLGQVRERLGRAIPLAWSPDEFIDIAAIEVYPAATLRGLGIAAVAQGAETDGHAHGDRCVARSLRHTSRGCGQASRRMPMHWMPSCASWQRLTFSMADACRRRRSRARPRSGRDGSGSGVRDRALAVKSRRTKV